MSCIAAHGTEPIVQDNSGTQSLIRSSSPVDHPCTDAVDPCTANQKKINVLSAISGEHICTLHGLQDLAQLKSAVSKASQVPEWQQLLILDGQPLHDGALLHRASDMLECTVLLLRKSEDAMTMDKMMDWHLRHVIEQRFLEDPEFMLAAVKASGAALQYANETMRKNPLFVLAAVQQSGAALQYGDFELRQSWDFMLSAVRASCSSIVHASPELLKDADFLLAAIQANSEVVGFIGALPQVQNIRRDKYAMLSVVQVHGSALRFASPCLRKDKDVVMKALRTDPEAIRYCPVELRTDPDIRSILASGAS